jgi:hypothetical protein
MTATDPTEEQTARRPMSYAGAVDTGPCEGRHASPSNPTCAGKTRTKVPLTETFVFRCSAAEKARLRATAEAAGLLRPYLQFSFDLDSSCLSIGLNSGGNV